MKKKLFLIAVCFSIFAGCFAFGKKNSEVKPEQLVEESKKEIENDEIIIKKNTDVAEKAGEIAGNAAKEIVDIGKEIGEKTKDVRKEIAEEAKDFGKDVSEQAEAFTKSFKKSLKKKSDSKQKSKNNNIINGESI